MRVQMGSPSGAMKVAFDGGGQLDQGQLDRFLYNANCFDDLHLAL
jgi:hypothetical protein